MSFPDEKHDGTTPRQGSHADVEDLHANNVFKSELLVDSALMSSAYDGENYEHSQGLWAAVKSHPKAAFWAFTMCFTIVSRHTYNASLAIESDREL